MIQISPTHFAFLCQPSHERRPRSARPPPLSVRHPPLGIQMARTDGPADLCKNTIISNTTLLRKTNFLDPRPHCPVHCCRRLPKPDLELGQAFTTPHAIPPSPPPAITPEGKTLAKTDGDEQLQFLGTLRSRHCNSFAPSVRPRRLPLQQNTDNPRAPGRDPRGAVMYCCSRVVQFQVAGFLQPRPRWLVA